MKFKTIAATAVFATLGSSAFAQAYVGIGVGASRTCSAYNTVSGCGNTDTAAKALAGYALPGTDFAVEGVYTHLGTLKVDSLQGRVDRKGDIFGVGGAWRPQFGAGWGGVARAGLAWGTIKTDYSLVQLGTPLSTLDGSQSNNAWLPTLGLGATYSITHDIRLEADWDYARVRARPGSVPAENFNTYTLGATFAF